MQDGWTPIAIATKNAFKDVVELLLEAKADVTIANKFGYAPHQANVSKEIQDLLRVNEVLIELAVAGDVVRLTNHLQSSESINVNYQNKDGWSALVAAAYHGKLGTVQLLLATPGVNVELQTHIGNTALYASAFSGHWEVVKLLLKAGANGNRTNNNGDTAVYAAAINGHRLVVKELVEARVDLSVVNKKGESPLYGASSKGHSIVVKILADAKVDVESVDSVSSVGGIVEFGII